MPGFPITKELPKCPQCGMGYDEMRADKQTGQPLYIHGFNGKACLQVPGRQAQKIKL